MSENNRKQNRNNNRNRQQGQNGKRNQNQQSKNFENKDQKETDKEVPMRYEAKAAKAVKALEAIDLKLGIDSMNEKVKLTIFEDRTDEMKEFTNMIETYE